MKESKKRLATLSFNLRSFFLVGGCLALLFIEYFFVISI